MIDWLRSDQQAPALKIDGREIAIELVPHARAKRMILRLGRDGNAVRVTYPTWGRRADAIRFAQERTDWVALQIAKRPVLPTLLERRWAAWRGEELAIAHDPAAPRAGVLRDRTLSFGGPEGALPTRIECWLKADALDRMTDDLAFYCERANVAVPALKLSNARRRWGSCSASGAVRINWRLVQAPDFVRRSVVAHEVAHLVQFDHSPAFHALMQRIYDGDVAQADAWLKRHGFSLYNDFG